MSFVYPTLTELHEPEEAKLEGSIPEWLHDSAYLRTGRRKFLDFKSLITIAELTNLK